MGSRQAAQPPEPRHRHRAEHHDRRGVWQAPAGLCFAAGQQRPLRVGRRRPRHLRLARILAPHRGEPGKVQTPRDDDDAVSGLRSRFCQPPQGDVLGHESEPQDGVRHARRRRPSTRRDDQRAVLQPTHRGSRRLHPTRPDRSITGQDRSHATRTVPDVQG